MLPYVVEGMDSCICLGKVEANLKSYDRINKTISYARTLGVTDSDWVTQKEKVKVMVEKRCELYIEMVRW